MQLVSGCFERRRKRNNSTTQRYLVVVHSRGQLLIVVLLPLPFLASSRLGQSGEIVHQERFALREEQEIDLIDYGCFNVSEVVI